MVEVTEADGVIYGTSTLDKNVKTSVKVSQPSGGITKADGVIYGTSTLDEKPAKTSVKVSQPSGGFTTLVFGDESLMKHKEKAQDSVPDLLPVPQSKVSMSSHHQGKADDWSQRLVCCFLRFVDRFRLTQHTYRYKSFSLDKKTIRGIRRPLHYPNFVLHVQHSATHRFGVQPQ